LRASAVLAVLLALLLTSIAIAQNPAPIGVVSSAGRRSLPATLVGGQDYVALDDVAAFLPLSLREDRQGLIVTVRGKTIVAPRDRNSVLVDSRVVVQLPGPVTRVGNRWHVPVDFVPRALGPVADQRIEYRRASRLLVLGNVRMPRVTTRVEPAGAGARVTIEIAPPSGVMTVTDADRIVVRVDADALDFAPVAGSAPSVALVRADPPASVTVVLSMAAEARPTVTTTDTAARVVIDVPAAQAPESSSAAPPAAPPAAAAPPPVMPPATAGFRTVVIDPGHGGDDAGVKGPAGTVEKQLTLDLAKRLKGVLEARLGVHVVLTRDDDRAATLDERTATANNAKGDLFVSLHMNASPSPGRTGPAVFFMRLGREGEDTRREAGAQAVALPVLGGGTRVIETIRWDLAQARHIDDSQRLAGLLAAALEGRGGEGTTTPPVQAAPLRVLAGLDMPAVLFEMAYLTNAEQEKTAGTDDARGAIVQAVFDAVSRFASGASAEPAPPPATPPTPGPRGAPAPAPSGRGRR
jgi:N-acetylmuramoyl-L-alanine amidase